VNTSQILFALGGGPKMAQGVSGAGHSLVGSQQVNITWTNPNATLYDYVTIERSINAGAYSQVAQPAKGTTSYLDTPGFSLDATYRIIAHHAGWTDAAAVSAGTQRTLPNTPSVQNLTAQNPGQITFSATSPGHSNINSFEVRISTDNGGSYGGAVNTGADPSHVFSGIGHGLAVRVQTRTLDGFSQYSGWVEWGSYVASINDVTGPPAPTPTVGAWDLGLAAYNVSWPSHYDSQSGNQATYCQYSENGGAWTTIGGMGFPAGGAWSGYLGGYTRPALVQWRLVTYDVYGNATVGAASAQVWTRPIGGAIIFPGNSHTWGNVAGWRSADDRVIGGAYGGQENYGFWFYGTAIADWCKGFTPDRMYFMCQKVSGLSVAGNAYLAVHDATTDTGAVPGIGGIFHAPYLTTDESNELFGSGWYPGFANGTYRGACCIGNGAAFKALYGKSEQAYSGAMTIYFDQ